MKLSAQGAEAEEEAVQRLSTVISSTIGLLSDDIPLLQQALLEAYILPKKMIMARTKSMTSQFYFYPNQFPQVIVLFLELCQNAVAGVLT
eukprot:2671446-Amphidinium_carterae.1